MLIGTLSQQHSQNMSKALCASVEAATNHPTHTTSERPQAVHGSGSNASLTGSATSQHLDSSAPLMTAATLAQPATSHESNSSATQGKASGATTCAALTQLLSSVDKVVRFQPMTPSAIARVVGMQVQAVSGMLVGFGVVDFEVEERVHAWLADRAVGAGKGSMEGVEAAVRMHLLMPATDVLLSAIATNGARSGSGGSMLGEGESAQQGGPPRWGITVKCPARVQARSSSSDLAGVESHLASSSLQISIQRL